MVLALGRLRSCIDTSQAANTWSLRTVRVEPGRRRAIFLTIAEEFGSRPDTFIPRPDMFDQL